MTQVQPIDKACTALGLIEQLNEVTENLAQLTAQLPPEHRSEHEVYVGKLRAIVAALDTDLVSLPVVQGSEQASKLAKFSKITRLGIAGELVRLRATGKYTIEDLAVRFDVPAQQISRFFRYYDACSPSEKARVRRQSVFEISERLEDLLQIIVRQLARLEAVNDEVHVKYVAEFRQTVAMAANLLEKVNHYHRFQQLITAVGDLLVKELPHRQREITEAIYQLAKSITDTKLEP